MPLHAAIYKHLEEVGWPHAFLAEFNAFVDARHSSDVVTSLEIALAYVPDFLVARAAKAQDNKDQVIARLVTISYQKTHESQEKIAAGEKRIAALELQLHNVIGEMGKMITKLKCADARLKQIESLDMKLGAWNGFHNSLMYEEQQDLLTQS